MARRLPLAVSDSCAIIQCPFYRICEHSSCDASSVAYEPGVRMEFRVCFPATSQITFFFSQKCLKVLEFLSHTDVLCDTAPVFRDPIDSTFCVYCYRIEFACCIYKWKCCLGVCISCSHTTLCVKCTSSRLL